uniref:Recombinase n=1 Tax=Glaesserella parasuis TaxID=738 RepID=F1CNF7_GLAPU|nr:recombinase [Glaesserella parasuis]
MALVGYARVSSVQQDLTEQIEALKKYGCEKIFSGKHSGKAKDNKEQLDKMLDYVREGDVVVVTKVDRLGRSLNQVLNILESFREQNIGFVAIQQNVDTTKKSDPLAMAMIQLLGVFAELERNFIVERTQEGIRAKREAGEKCGGRPAALTESKLKQFKADAESGLSLSVLGHKYKISRATAQRYRTSLKVNKGENYEN